MVHRLRSFVKMHQEAACVSMNEDVWAGQCLTLLFTRLGAIDSHTARVDIVFFSGKVYEISWF
jgi:hypothetical protein